MKFLFLFFLISIPILTISQEVQKPANDSLTILSSENKSTYKWGEKTITIVKNDTTKKSSEFLLSLGFNFDFLNGIKANDLYADVNVEVPFIFRNSKDKSNNWKYYHYFGFEFGAYQMRNISEIDSFAQIFRQIEGRKVDNNLILDYITTGGQTKLITSRENLGIFVQPKYTLLKSFDSESRFNFVLHLEWVRSIVTSRLSTNFTSRDTTDVAPDEWPRPYVLTDRLPLQNTNDKRVEYNTNLGAGIDFTLIRKSGSIHFKSILGYNNFRYVRNSENFNSVLFQDASNFFYLIQSEIMEKEIIGLKLGVEVRGYFKKKQPQIILDRNTPNFTIYLAKQFSFEKIAEFFKP